MSTTNNPLLDALKTCIANAAEAVGATPHHVILKAIAGKAGLTKRRSDFHDEAECRWGHFLQTGESIPLDEMRRYLTGRFKGEATPRMCCCSRSTTAQR